MEVAALIEREQIEIPTEIRMAVRIEHDRANDFERDGRIGKERILSLESRLKASEERLYP